MIFLPSRGRREVLQRFFAVSAPSVVGRVLIDDDDEETYAGMVLPDGWEFLCSRRTGIAKRINLAFRAFPDELWYAMMADDVECGPAGWDRVLAAVAQPCYVAWGNDPKWGEKLCTTFFVGGDLVRKIGFLVAPVFRHLYIDRVWHDIATGAGLGRYHPEVSCRVTRVRDKTWMERRAEMDPNRYFEYNRSGEIGKLISVAKTFGKGK